MWEEAQGKETKKLIDWVIQEAKQQGILLEDLAKSFLELLQVKESILIIYISGF